MGPSALYWLCLLLLLPYAQLQPLDEDINTGIEEDGGASTADGAHQDKNKGRGSKGGSGGSAKDCTLQWRKDQLMGRCHGKGMGHYADMFPHLAHKRVKSAEMCKQLCCNLGHRCACELHRLYCKILYFTYFCVAWQFGGGKSNDDCRLGGPVRFGDERTALAVSSI
jgi:hypothetical protein